MSTPSEPAKGSRSLMPCAKYKPIFKVNFICFQNSFRSDSFQFLNGEGSHFSYLGRMEWTERKLKRIPRQYSRVVHLCQRLFLSTLAHLFWGCKSQPKDYSSRLSNPGWEAQLWYQMIFPVHYHLQTSNDSKSHVVKQCHEQIIALKEGPPATGLTISTSLIFYLLHWFIYQKQGSKGKSKRTHACNYKLVVSKNATSCVCQRIGSNQR